jgi:hypothetical protein
MPTDRLRHLTAAEYREALALVLAELEDLNPADHLDTAQRLSRLKTHIATVVGQVSPRMEPIYGLRALRARHRGPIPDAAAAREPE